MPVWHEATKELVAAGKLRVIGVVQEQHPERAALWLKWQQIDWPVAWDPFNQLGVKVVPKIVAVQPGGLVLEDRLHPKRISEEGGLLEVMGRMAGAAEELDQPARFGPQLARGVGSDAQARAQALEPESALAILLFDPEGLDGDALPLRLEAMRSLVKLAQGDQASARDHFRAGVAQRMLLDEEAPVAGRFQAALHSWSRALALDPGQYIWRRRIQQWGPRLDKPYPFYDWVPLARKELIERGVTPRVWRVALSGTERAKGGYDLPVPQIQENPDPRGQIPSDQKEHVSLDWAVAPHTGFAGPNVRVAAGTSRVHLTLLPKKNVSIEPAGGPLGIWIDLPGGWRARSSWFDLQVEGDGSVQSPHLDFELIAPPLGPPQEGAPPPSPPVLRGFVLYPVCIGESGECNLLRRDFELDLSPAR